MTRYAKRRDKNEAEIADALRKAEEAVDAGLIVAGPVGAAA